MTKLSICDGPAGIKRGDILTATGTDFQRTFKVTEVDGSVVTGRSLYWWERVMFWLRERYRTWREKEGGRR